MSDKEKNDVAKGGTSPDERECRLTGSREACCGTGEKNRCKDKEKK